MNTVITMFRCWCTFVLSILFRLCSHRIHPCFGLRSESCFSLCIALCFILGSTLSFCLCSTFRCCLCFYSYAFLSQLDCQKPFRFLALTLFLFFENVFWIWTFAFLLFLLLILLVLLFFSCGTIAFFLFFSCFPLLFSLPFHAASSHHIFSVCLFYDKKDIVIYFDYCLLHSIGSDLIELHLRHN